MNQKVDFNTNTERNKKNHRDKPPVVIPNTECNP